MRVTRECRNKCERVIMEATKRVSIEATKRESMEANTGDDDAFYLFLQKQSINEDVLTISSARFRVQGLGFRLCRPYVQQCPGEVCVGMHACMHACVCVCVCVCVLFIWIWFLKCKFKTKLCTDTPRRSELLGRECRETS
jgi:hypothetical protein